MTNPTPHGQVPAIQRYKIGYYFDEWGVRSLSPIGIYDDAGPWVRYEDHAAALCRLHAENDALRAQQPAPEDSESGWEDGYKHGAWSTQQPAPATQQAGEVRRAELVPGVMHCAKCKFQLNRVTLCVSDGNAYAGNNKTEPCPNGCGPLWPVTWEQEAKNCWKALEEMHERLMAAAAPQPSPTAQAAESVPAIQGEMNVQLDTDPNTAAPGQQRDVARSVALGQPMGNGQDQAAGRPSAQGDKLLTVAERNIRSFLRSAQFKSESDREAALNCVDVLWAAARAPADSVLEDAARPNRRNEKAPTESLRRGFVIGVESQGVHRTPNSS